MASKNLTAERLRELLHYDPNTGVFINIAQRKRVVVGDVAGCIDPSNGYIKICIDYGKHYAHRLAFLYMTGEWPSKHVDHINGDKVDNSWSNLRDVSRSTNLQNIKKQPSNGTSGLLGAQRKRKRWSSKIRVNGAIVPLGSFATAEEAHNAYIEAKRKFHEGCTL